MTLDQGIAAIIAAIIVTAAGFFAGMITSRQKNDELLMLAIKHLCGGSQERNVGISAIELYWNKNRQRDLCVSMLVGAGIYLLRESKQKDAQHELYNLSRIMDFLLTKKQLYSKKHSVLVYYKHLDDAIRDALADVESDAKMESVDPIDKNQEVIPRHGLWVDKVRLETWRKQLNPEHQITKSEEGHLGAITDNNSTTEKSILEKYSAKINSIKKEFNNPLKLITIEKGKSKSEFMTAEQNEWWYCVEGTGIMSIENNNHQQSHFLQPDSIVPIAKGMKFTIQNKNQTPLQLVVFNQ